MYCHQCGKEVGDAKFCPYCGTSLTANQAVPTYQPINQQTTSGQDESSFGFALLSFFIPIVGFILFLVWNKEFPLKAKSCLKGFISGIVFYVVIICCSMAAFFSAVSNNNHYDPYNDYEYDFDSIVEVIPYESINQFIH